MQKPLIIGISALAATSGKDTFANLLVKHFNEKNIYAKKYNLADALKADLYFLIKQHFNIDIYSCKPSEKERLRPLLVVWGKIFREHTEGKHWTQIVENKIKNDHVSVGIVADIRYSTYKQDEVDWIRNQMGGVLVYIARYENVIAKNSPPFHNQSIDLGKSYILPPNQDERENAPKLEEAADYKIDIETVAKDKIEQEWLKHVQAFTNWLKENGRI